MTLLVALSYVLNISIILAITYFLYNKAKGDVLARYFLPGLLFKFAAGISLGLIYKFYYHFGDTYAFQEGASILTDVAYSNPIQYLKIVLLNDIPKEASEIFALERQPRVFFITKLLSMAGIITYKNYWLSGLYFSYFSYVGMYYLANTLATYFPSKKRIAGIAFLLFPSVVFWSAGVSKESIVMGSLCFIVGFSIPFLTVSKKIWLPKVLLMTLFFWLLLKLKYYYVGVLIPVMAANFIVAALRFKFKSIQKNYFTHLGTWLVVFFLLLYLATNIHPNLSTKNFFKSVVETHNLIYEKSNLEDLITYNKLEPNVKSFVSNIPWALFSGLYRPTFLDAKSKLQYWVAFENLVLMLLTIGALTRLFKITKYPHKILMFSAMVYIIILAIFMALSSPNFGTLVRYKIGFLPFFIFLISINNPIIDFLKKRMKLPI